MKYAVLIYEDEARWAAAGESERQRYIDGHAAFNKSAAEGGIAVIAGEALRSVSSATTQRRRRSDFSITDGPFAETAEQLGGFYLVDSPSLDEILEAARELPEDTIEIRPVVVL